MKDLVWNIKHRPKKVMDVVSPYKHRISKYLENKETIPNFLFYSRTGGTGKSSMALAIVRELGCDVLTLNASADRSIDNIRNKVKEFARSTSSKEGLKRCVFMDEAEKLTKDAMDALKNMIEEYAANTFYIFTTNNIEKINQTMQSRFTAKYEFLKPDRNEIKDYLISICNTENMKYKHDHITNIVNRFYPSIREMVNILQDMYIENKKTINYSDVTKNEYDEVFELIKKMHFKKFHEYVIKNNFDCNGFNKWLFETIPYNEELSMPKKIKIIQTLAKNELAFKQGADEKIIFIGSIPSIMLQFKEEK